MKGPWCIVCCAIATSAAAVCSGRHIQPHMSTGRQRAPFSLPRSKYRAVTVLHAPCNTLAYTLANIAGNLAKEWSIAVLYNDDLHAFVSSTKVVQTLTADNRLHSVPLAKAGFDTLPTTSTRGYSRLLKSHAFWRYLAADHVLTFQTDSVLCSMSPWRGRTHARPGCRHRRPVPAQCQHDAAHYRDVPHERKRTRRRLLWAVL